MIKVLIRSNELILHRYHTPHDPFSPNSKS